MYYVVLCSNQTVPKLGTRCELGSPIERELWGLVEHKDKASAAVLCHSTCLEAFVCVGCKLKLQSSKMSKLD